MLDSIWNTRDLFRIFLDPGVYIMFSPEASGFRWLCHVGFCETAENPWSCTTYGVPQPTSEEAYGTLYISNLYYFYIFGGRSEDYISFTSYFGS